MLLWENIQLALEGLRANKMRSLLTMLGIIIGTGAVIAIVTVGGALTQVITAQMRSIGANNVQVTLHPRGGLDFTVGFGGAPPAPLQRDLMTGEMVNRFYTAHHHSIAALALTRPVGSGWAANGEDASIASIIGVNSDFKRVNSVEIVSGRFIGEGDGLYAVISHHLAQELFPQSDPLGQKIRIDIGENTDFFAIIGVYEHTAMSLPFLGMGNNAAGHNDLYIPISAAGMMAEDGQGFQSFVVMAEDGVDIDGFVAQIIDFFSPLYAHNPRFTVAALPMATILGVTETMMAAISIAVAVIAGISLMVGGVGVMNIMLVSVTERTREIGTRKALGATNAAIRLQFVAEAVIICAIGGAFGVILGIVLGYAGSLFLENPVLPPLSIIFIALGFAMAIGLFFGYYPANKAAKLDPIEALRHE
ncbi:MAG: ABC transporter permease [Defluviitaleaceae bacterium]|nr:ABC transporter permease [Defluviitaleaceae bacterium]